jgi:hypothetical protein
LLLYDHPDRTIATLLGTALKPHPDYSVCVRSPLKRDFVCAKHFYDCYTRQTPRSLNSILIGRKKASLKPLARCQAIQEKSLAFVFAFTIAIEQSGNLLSQR